MLQSNLLKGVLAIASTAFFASLVGCSSGKGQQPLASTIPSVTIPTDDDFNGETGTCTVALHSVKPALVLFPTASDAYYYLYNGEIEIDVTRSDSSIDVDAAGTADLNFAFAQVTELSETVVRIRGYLLYNDRTKNVSVRMMTPSGSTFICSNASDAPAGFVSSNLKRVYWKYEVKSYANSVFPDYSYSLTNNSANGVSFWLGQVAFTGAVALRSCTTPGPNTFHFLASTCGAGNTEVEVLGYGPATAVANTTKALYQAKYIAGGNLGGYIASSQAALASIISAVTPAQWAWSPGSLGVSVF